MKRSWRDLSPWATASVLVLLLGGCGDSIKDASFATLEAFTAGLALSPGGTVSVSPAGIAVGEEGTVAEIRIINTGGAELDISSLTIESTPPGAFRLATAAGAELSEGPHSVAPQADVTATNRALLVYLRLTRPAAGTVPTATITVLSNSVNSDGEKTPTITFEVEMEQGAPKLQVVPSVVDFETVALGDSELKSVNLLNQGNDDLLIEGFALTGHPNFALVVGAERYPVSQETGAGITFDEPIVVGAGEVVAVSVAYEATGPEEASGRIVFDSNDPSAPGGTIVDLQANVGGPCIAVNPKKVDFGGKLLGRPARVEVQITSCGDKPLSLTEIVLLQDSSPEYTLSLETLPGIGGGGEPVGALGPADPPIVLNPNQTARFAVEYLPGDLSPIDGTGLPVRDLGTVRIRSNSFVAETIIDVSGFGVDKECPTPVIVVQEGEEVIPQTRLHLIGSQSFAATGTIEKWEWRATQPVGSASVFQPNANAIDPTFEVNVAGRYEFELVVTDSTGEKSCAPARAEVFVNPDEAIHIELLWDTPNDLDQTDDGPVAGADLDLHFLHPFAVANGYDGDKDGLPDGYFDIPHDAFWFNDKPNWGSFGAIDDDPSLDRDDTDGAGPENINLNLPQNVCYKIGVHYWDDHGFGDSYATVRVYLYSSLVFEMTDVQMSMLDMWTVTSLCWPPDPGAPLALKKVCEETYAPCASDAECGGDACGPLIVPNYEQNILPQ